ALAWMIVDDPAAYDWRVVDAALTRLTCSRSESALTTGPRSLVWLAGVRSRRTSANPARRGAGAGRHHTRSPRHVAAASAGGYHVRGAGPRDLRSAARRCVLRHGEFHRAVDGHARARVGILVGDDRVLVDVRRD